MEQKTKFFGKTLFATAFVAVLLASIAGAQSVNSAVSLSQLSVTPQPVVAGGNVVISFQLYNSYVNQLKNVVIQAITDSPIANVSPSTSVLINSIGAGGTVGSGGIGFFVYTFHVPSTLTAGEYTIDIQVTYDTVYGSGALTSDQPGTSIVPISFYVYGNPNIQLSAVPQGQITPGGETLFQITALNTGTDTARNVSVALLSSANFTPYGTPVLNFGIMGVGTAATQQGTLLIATNLATGNVGIPVRVSYTAQSGIKSNYTTLIPLSFVNGIPNIVTSIASAVPQQLGPGGNQTLSISIQNTGYSVAKNLTVRFLSSPPLSVTGSASSYFIGNLQPGAQTTEQIQLSADRNANQSTYYLPVIISYSGLGYGSNSQSTQNIPIRLQNSAIFNITRVYGNLTPGGTSQPLVLVIKNTGNEPAQQVTLSLQTVYPLSPSNPSFYINQLLPGQSANATFFVSTASQGTNGAYPITLYEQWRQPNGYTTQQYSSSNNYFATVSTAGGLDGYGTFIGIAIILVIAVLAYQRREMIIKMVAKQREKNKK
jgi:hypothetical protein